VLSGEFSTTEPAEGDLCEGFRTEFFVKVNYTNISESRLTDLEIEVAELSGGRILGNADTPGGAGAILTVPETGDYSDGTLGPGENVDIDLVFCLPNPGSFTASINIYGTNLDPMPVNVTISAPSGLSVVNTDTVTVSGKAENASSLTINGERVNIGVQGSGGNTFTTNVILEEGLNTITAVASRSSGGSASDTVQVVKDTVPPVILIETPETGSIITRQQADIAGMVNDTSSGISANGDEVSVTVNGRQAEVSNGSFVISDLPLQRGLNTITASATDSAGNTGTSSVDITVQDRSGQRVIMLSGTGQSGDVNTQLTNPLVVALENNDGQRVVNREVIFKVVRGDGILSSFPEEGKELTVRTDDKGIARVLFTLGSRSGAGNHRVSATSLGFLGEVVFCPTAFSGSSDLITSISGDRQTGSTGDKLSNPLVALVIDPSGNPVPGVKVKFMAERGGGNFSGNETADVTTNADGEAVVYYTLGEEEGVNNNLIRAYVTASADGTLVSTSEIDGAVFTASAKASDVSETTLFSGIVLDNQDTPIEGVTVKIDSTVVPTDGTIISTKTDNQGFGGRQHSHSGRQLARASLYEQQYLRAGEFPGHADIYASA